MISKLEGVLFIVNACFAKGRAFSSNCLKILSNWVFHRGVVILEKVEEKIMCSTTLYCLKLIRSKKLNSKQ